MGIIRRRPTLTCLAAVGVDGRTAAGEGHATVDARWGKTTVRPGGEGSVAGVYAAEDREAGMEEFGVGVVGGGWMASDYHLPTYDDHPATRVAAVAELDERRRRDLADQYGIAGYATVDELLDGEDLDIVSICTPPATHHDIFLAAARAGCHVFCEKPLATGAESARDLRRAADEAGIVTQVGYLSRYYGNTERAMAVLRNDLLGELIEVRTSHHSTLPGQGWYFDPDLSGGGVMRDLLPHSLDVYIDLFGEATVERCWTREIHGRGVEDTATLELLVGEVPVEITVGWTRTEGYTRHVAVGTEGWLEYDGERLEGAIHGRPFEFENGESPLVDIGLTKLYGATSDDAHAERLRDFVEHVVRDDPATQAPVSRGVHVAETIDAAYEAAGGEP